MDIANWYGLAGPKGLPRAVVSRLHAETSRVLAEPDLRSMFDKEAIDIITSSPEAFGEYLRGETVKWGRLVRSSGLRID